MMLKIPLIFLCFVIPAACTQPAPLDKETNLGAWSIEEFTLDTGRVFLSAAGQDAARHRLLLHFMQNVDECDTPAFNFVVSTASFSQHRKTLGDEAFDTWLENEFKGSEVDIALQVADYKTKEMRFTIKHVFNFTPNADMIGDPVFKTDMVVLRHSYIPLWLISGSGEAVTLTISENSPHYPHFDMPIESFSLNGFHEATNKAHALCKQRLNIKATDGGLMALLNH